MAWTAQCTVSSVSEVGYVAAGTATGTDDDTDVTSVTVQVNTNSQTHLVVGDVIELTSNC